MILVDRLSSDARQEDILCGRRRGRRVGGRRVRQALAAQFQGRAAKILEIQGEAGASTTNGFAKASATRCASTKPSDRGRGDGGVQPRGRAAGAAQILRAQRRGFDAVFGHGDEQGLGAVGALFSLEGEGAPVVRSAARYDAKRALDAGRLARAWRSQRTSRTRCWPRSVRTRRASRSRSSSSSGARSQSRRRPTSGGTVHGEAAPSDTGAAAQLPVGVFADPVILFSTILTGYIATSSWNESREELSARLGHAQDALASCFRRPTRSASPPRGRGGHRRALAARVGPGGKVPAGADAGQRIELHLPVIRPAHPDVRGRRERARCSKAGPSPSSQGRLRGEDWYKSILGSQDATWFALYGRSREVRSVKGEYVSLGVPIRAKSSGRALGAVLVEISGGRRAEGRADG